MEETKETINNRNGLTRKDLCSRYIRAQRGNYKTLLNGIKNELNRWRIIPCLKIGRGYYKGVNYPQSVL